MKYLTAVVVLAAGVLVTGVAAACTVDTVEACDGELQDRRVGLPPDDGYEDGTGEGHLRRPERGEPRPRVRRAEDGEVCRNARTVRAAEAPETGAVGEIGEIKPGAVKRLTLQLKKGHYSLICNLTGHYDNGQFVDFYVRTP